MSEGHVVPIRVYIAIFFALMVLTALTVYVSTQDYGRLNVVVAATVAVSKATLVVLYFMHVRYSDKLTWVIAAAGFLWLFVLFVLTMSDYSSRGWLLIYN